MESRPSIEERVYEVVAKQFGIGKNRITRDSRFVKDFGADSLDVIELTMALSEEFDIGIPDNEAEKLFTVGLAIDYIEAKLRQPVSP